MVNVPFVSRKGFFFFFSPPNLFSIVKFTLAIAISIKHKVEQLNLLGIILEQPDASSPHLEI
jgi:hypothetical protein